MTRKNRIVTAGIERKIPQRATFAVASSRAAQTNVGWLLNVPATNMLVYLRDGSTQTIVRAATLR